MLRNYLPNIFKKNCGYPTKKPSESKFGINKLVFSENKNNIPKINHLFKNKFPSKLFFKEEAKIVNNLKELSSKQKDMRLKNNKVILFTGAGNKQR